MLICGLCNEIGKYKVITGMKYDKKSAGRHCVTAAYLAVFMKLNQSASV